MGTRVVTESSASSWTSERRSITRRSLLAVSAASVTAFAARAEQVAVRGVAFKLNYAPHEGMFRHLGGPDIVDQIEFAADQGFSAWEDNHLSRRSVSEQKRIATALERNNMRLGVFVAPNLIDWRDKSKPPTLTTGASEAREAFLNTIRGCMEIAKRVNATWVTVVPGWLDASRPIELQTANVVDALRAAAELFEPHGLIMVIEPLNHYRDHAGVFLSTGAQAYAITRAVDSPSCKILFDVYHQQIQAGNLIATMDFIWNDIGYIQFGDNPGRNEPTTGEINYGNICRFIHQRGYPGVIGMEHGNSAAGAAGEQKVIDAYRYCDSFIA